MALFKIVVMDFITSLPLFNKGNNAILTLTNLVIKANKGLIRKEI
jgi:hypothetical protein